MASPGSKAGDGGAGSPNSISGSPVTYAGGGGGSGYNVTVGSGGTGGGGAGGGGASINGAGVAGSVNTGGGGGGSAAGDYPGPGSGGPYQFVGGNGGSGIVVVRYPSAVAPAISLSPGTNVKTTAPAPSGGCGVATFTVSGTLTVAQYE